MNNNLDLIFSDLANDLLNSINQLFNFSEDNRDKIIKRKIRFKGKIKYQYLIRHNILVDTFPLAFPTFALRNLHRQLKK